MFPMRRRLGKDARVLIGVFVVALSVGLFFARSGPSSYDGGIMLQVTQSIVNDHSLLVHHDVSGSNTPYSSYGIGLSLVMIPPYELARAVGADPVSAAMDVNAVIFAFTMVALVVLARFIGLTRRQALTTALLVGGGTMLLAYAPTDLSEPGVALAIAIGLVCLTGARSGRRWAPALAGGAAGIAVLFRTDSIVLVVPILALGIWSLGRRRTRDLAEFGVALAPALGLLAWYNTVRFGVPWRLGYGGQPFNHSFLAGAYGLLLSPDRGLLIFVPLTLVAAAGSRWAWQRDRLVTAAAIALVLVRVLFFAKWWAWDGGGAWGPRFLVPALPCLALGLGEVVRRYGRLGLQRQALVVLIAGVGISMQVVAASVDVIPRSPPPPASVAHLSGLSYVTSPSVEASVDSFHNQWKLVPMVYESRVLLDGGRSTSATLSPRPQYLRLVVLVCLCFGGCAIAFGSCAERDREPSRRARRDHRHLSRWS